MVSHPKGTRARVLLTSVFGPFARDDEFGSRAINPVELDHNQVTREQGPFSLRMFHRSWNLMFLQRNISAPCTVLDFPTRDRFVRELTAYDYDIVGITSIVVNVGKVREMCRLVREHSPRATIVVGGHVTAIPGIETTIDADHVVKGEGVSWLRGFLGEDVERAVEHPLIPSSFGFRVMGLPAPRGGGNASATIIPSVGCPMGCNFCTTSQFFGGKGKVITFFERGADLFRVMCETQRRLGVRAFFMMDENFLLYKRRALELLALMKAHGKVWSLYVFRARAHDGGWRRYHDDPDPLRARVAAEAQQLRWGHGAALLAMERYMRHTFRTVSGRIRDLRQELEREFGGVSRVVNHVVGPVLLWSARREARRFPGGRALEPRTFVERTNWA
jgi:hypothetical protein